MANNGGHASFDPRGEQQELQWLTKLTKALRERGPNVAMSRFNMFL